jgi:hypothetical protein
MSAPDPREPWDPHLPYGAARALGAAKGAGGWFGGLLAETFLRTVLVWIIGPILLFVVVGCCLGGLALAVFAGGVVR